MREHRRWITTLVLVVICGALAAYVLLVESKREPPPEEGALPTPAPLWEFESGDVVEMAVTKGEQTTAVERADGEWRMTEPEESETDDTRLNSLVAGLAGLTYSRALADVGDGSAELAEALAAFGLREPEFQVTLTLSGGTTIHLAIGAENPRRTDRYVQKENDPLVYLVSSAGLQGLLDLVDRPPYPPTPTPPPTETPTPGPSPTPTLAVSPTPTLGPSPAPTAHPSG